MTEQTTRQGELTWTLDEAIDSTVASGRVEAFWPLGSEWVWVRSVDDLEEDPRRAYIAVTVDGFLRIADELRAAKASPADPGGPH